jgi:hypothetical protein
MVVSTKRIKERCQITTLSVLEPALARGTPLGAAKSLQRDAKKPPN